MAKRVKDLITDLHYHEALDRTWMIIDILDRHLIQHPVFKAEKEYAKKVEKAGLLLAEAYQIIGQIYFEKTENNRITDISRTKGK